jgi:hypothetical protein
LAQVAEEEIRAGEMLRNTAERKERQEKGQPRRKRSQRATLIPELSVLGVTKTQSSPAPTPEPAQINVQPLVVAEMPAEPKQPMAHSAQKNGTIAPFAALAMPVGAAQPNGTAPAETAVTPPANARTSRRARPLRQPKGPALAPEGT